MKREIKIHTSPDVMCIQWHLHGDTMTSHFVVEVFFHKAAGVLRHEATVLPTHLGYHSDQPTYPGQMPVKECDVRPGRTCYYHDGNELAAQDVWTRYRQGGGDEEIIWKELEGWHDR